MIEFLVAYSKVTISLSNILGMEFVPGSPDNDTAIGRTLDAIFHYHNSGDVRARDVQLNRMALLAKNLMELQSFDASLFEDFKKTILASGNVDNFFGTRFEINIAATLARSTIPFRKSEAPDFLIDAGFGMAAIECTSARIRKQRQDYDLRYKIVSSLRGKTNKEYSNLHTALFLDITNLVYKTLDAGKSLSKLLDRKHLARKMSEFDFGNLTLFTYLSDSERGGIESAYARIDHPEIDRGLTALLDSCFPFGALPLNEFAVPEEG
jgi:hypothetical protein